MKRKILLTNHGISGKEEHGWSQRYTAAYTPRLMYYESCKRWYVPINWSASHFVRG
ncbi:MAG: hypothetical protein GIS02_06420 [Methanosarcinales archaeon]|uniref:Uncharacterized protein n=1 Tax=Candidatus Ethanoperedens thermophilum TaxID=2766897 RepID=A0A848DCC0_9EURY|nr:hypothetical protein [Candidatus Ethanoperedens thermophilum]